MSHRRYGWHSLARRGLSKSLSKCLSPVWSTEWLADEAIAWDLVRWVESRSVAELVGYDGRNFQRWHALGAAGQQPYRDLAARDAELATAKAEIAACKEQIKKKEADKKFVEEMTIKPLKKRLAAVRDKLAREMAKNKFLSAAVCPRTSPLCDATNA